MIYLDNAATTKPDCECLSRAEKFNNELQYQLNQFLSASDFRSFHIYDSEFLPLTILISLFLIDSAVITVEEITTDEIQPIKKNDDRCL